MLREARLLSALAPTPRVPEVLAVGDDESVIGSPFYIMERIEGEVVTSAVPAAFDSPEQRRRMGEELIDALVEVHAVKWEDCGLEGYGKPTGYLERQLRRFNGLWEHNRTARRPGGRARGRLAGRAPARVRARHDRARRLPPGQHDVRGRAAAPAGRDLRLGDGTIGDPLADVGYMCVLWSEASDPAGGLFDLSAVTRAEGFPTRAELVARYEERSGRSMRDARWYMALALWKSIVFMEGNYKRAISGTTDDPYLKTLARA